MRPRRRRRVAAAAAGAVVLLAMAQGAAIVAHLAGRDDGEQFDIVAEITPTAPGRTIDAYAGLGAWVDVFDYVPALQPAGRSPAVGVDELDAMAAAGVDTVYLQAAADRGDAGPAVAADTEAVEQLLVGAHARGMRVVGWYLPRFADVDDDLEHLTRIAELDVDGERFDGVAVDIEWTESVPSAARRSRRLVDLSERLRAAVTDAVLGAVVPPPVQLEDVNPAFWPGFPWRELAPLYDVWLPMTYWTDRRVDSGHREGHGYTVENVTRLRRALGDDGARVHPVGGVGGPATPEELGRYADAVTDVGAVGGSVYDWASLDGPARSLLAGRLGGLPATGIEAPPV